MKRSHDEINREENHRNEIRAVHDADGRSSNLSHPTPASTSAPSATSNFHARPRSRSPSRYTSSSKSNHNDSRTGFRDGNRDRDRDRGRERDRPRRLSPSRSNRSPPTHPLNSDRIVDRENFRNGRRGGSPPLNAPPRCRSRSPPRRSPPRRSPPRRSPHRSSRSPPRRDSNQPIHPPTILASNLTLLRDDRTTVEKEVPPNPSPAAAPSASSKENPVPPSQQRVATTATRFQQRVVVKEEDQHRLTQRQKQIEKGKNTLGYTRYLQTVPKHERRKNDPAHPRTPPAHLQMSKRAWDSHLAHWRRGLHQWDPPATGATSANAAAETKEKPSSGGGDAVQDSRFDEDRLFGDSGDQAKDSIDESLEDIERQLKELEENQ